jgi:type I restriction enzyme, S subunit
MTSRSVKLGEVAEILSGFAWSAKKFQTQQQGLPIIRIQNVNAREPSDFIYWNESFDERFVINDGDILLTLSGSFRVTKWRYGRALLNQRIVKITPKELLDSDYFLHFLSSQLLKIEAMGKHALVNNVSINDLRQLQIPLPPLEQQQKIAAILDAADALRTKRRESLARLEEWEC